MRKKIVYFILLFCAIIIQTSLLPLVSPGNIMGDIVLMLILAGAVIDGFFSFFSWAIFAGILYDLISYTTLGVHSIIFLLVVYFVSFFSRRFSVELRGVGLFLFSLFVVVATLTSRIISTLIISWDLQNINGFFRQLGSFSVISIQILYNIFFFFFCFIILRKTKKIFSI